MWEVRPSAVHQAQRSLVAGPLEIGFDWMSWIGALLLETQGQPAAALAMLSEAWDLIAPLRYVQAASRAMGPDLVRMALSAGDQQRALSVTDELERAAVRELAVGLVDHDQARSRGEHHLEQLAVVDRAGRVVGAAEEHDVGLLRVDARP